MSEVRENKMGTAPVPGLILSMSLPAMLSMLIQSLYNVVDSIFVAQLSEDALTAVSLAFPIQNLMIGFSVGTGVGMSSLLSRSLGARDMTEVNRSACNGIFLQALNWILFLLFGLFFSKTFFKLQTAGPVIEEMGTEYLFVVTVFSFGLFTSICFERLLQSTGRTTLSMAAQLCGAVTNIILDPILIFGLLGFPAMGVRGAAVATVLGQMVGALVAIVLNHRYNHEITLSFRGFKPSGDTIRRIYAVGVPSIVMQSIGSLMTLCLNKILIVFSATAVAVLGVYFKLQSFVFMPIFGLNNGMVPIVAYNYGARNKHRLLRAVRLGAVSGVTMALLGFAVFQLFPSQLLLLFDASSDMLAIGVPALRTISLSFLFAGFCIVASSAFQALGNGLYSLIVSIARQLGILLPAAFLFARFFGVRYVWYAFPLAEIASVALSTFFLIRIYRKKVRDL